jgi:hypothetical protein
MANKENIALLTKYQMRVLFYKCKEGATHEEIAEKLGRHVNTVQHHMTEIYKILEISAPGKSKEEMDSELKNEIGPIIRQMFRTVDEIKIWAPSKKKSPSDEAEQTEDKIQEPGQVKESVPPYQPPLKTNHQRLRLFNLHHLAGPESPGGGLSSRSSLFYSLRSGATIPL